MVMKIIKMQLLKWAFRLVLYSLRKNFNDDDFNVYEDSCLGDGGGGEFLSCLFRKFPTSVPRIISDEGYLILV